MTDSLIDRLIAHRTVGGIPRTELEWLAARGIIREFQPGDIMTAKGGVVAGMFLVLSGRLSIFVDRGAGPRKAMEWQAGDLTGLLPFSRLKSPPADVVAEVPTTTFLLERHHVDALTRECPELTAVCVHVMVDRARAFTSSDLLDEKMISLGRLAAGLAHELNNPASAVARSASTMVGALSDLDKATREFCGLGLTDAQCSDVQAVREAAADALRGPKPTTMQVADRQDEIADWLSAHDLSAIDPDRLVDAGVDVTHLERLTTTVGPAHMKVVVEHLAADQAVRRLASDVETAASRIHALVAAVKRFTYMDQAVVATPTHLGQGLADTNMMLASKARQKMIDLQLDVDDDLPLVEVFGGELNQVWTNLVDNAIDATPRGGRVVVSAGREGDTVVVRVADTGPGIPAEIQPRIFDPFFTTKDVGEGTGLGLDIAHRLVLRHRGQIDLTSSDVGTEFRVRLPIALDPRSRDAAREGQAAARG